MGITLGEGNSGTTYLAEPIAGGAQVALKALSLRSSQDWKTLELFEREVEILKALDHPAIPQYLESFVVETETDRHFYLAQTLAEGKNLADWVDSGWRCTEAEVEAIAIYEQLLEQQPLDDECKARILVQRGCALGKQGNLKAALVSHDQALALLPDDANALSSRGYTLVQLGQVQAGLAVLR